MVSTKNSNLNPLANTFVPSKSLVPSKMISLGKISTRSLASKMIKDIVDNKKANGEQVLTKEDLTGIVEKLIPLHYEIIPDKSLMSYLDKKVPEMLSLKSLIVVEKKGPYKDPSKTKYNFSFCKLPKPSILLVTLWGLYRHEQALRPMLSLTSRPEILEDKIWSVTSRDLKIWNPRAVENCCSCPPMFGYTIPPDFFGNPLKLPYSCTIKSIHLNRYPETKDGNEFTNLESFGENKIAFEDFEDFDKVTNARDDLEYYSEQLKEIVSSVCSIISDEDAESKGSTLIPNKPAPGDFMETLWDSDTSKLAKPMGDEVAEDDNCHPLLDECSIAEVGSYSEVSGICHEIEEMIRKSLSTESEAMDNANLAEETRERTGTCDPPCSVWCHSHPISRSGSVSSDVISLLNDTTEFLNSKNFASNESLNKSELKGGLNNSHKPYFRRSFSANDADLYDERYRMDTIPQISTSTREALSFLRKDPINFFKTLRNRNDSWKDNDSGIMSQWSSQEDVFSDNDCKETGETSAEYEDRAPMWSFFSGEGSLWKPLTSSTQSNEPSRIPHKRVRDLRRQKSVN